MVVMSLSWVNPKGHPSLDPRSPLALTPLDLLAFTMIQPSALGFGFLLTSCSTTTGKHVLPGACTERIAVKQCMG